MKEIRGITFEELRNKCIVNVEIDTGNGRHWKRGTMAEMESVIDAAQHEGTLSDIDFAVIENQPEEIRACLTALDELEDEGKINGMPIEKVFETYGFDYENDSHIEDREYLTHRLPKDNLLDIVKAGRATITLQSGDTGVYYTYKITKYTEADVWFVSLLIGTNNDEDFVYIGWFNNCNKFRTSSKSYMGLDATPVKAFIYFMQHIDNIPEKLGVFHAGKCCRCGRTLTTPTSVSLGIGPECIKMMGGVA